MRDQDGRSFISNLLEKCVKLNNVKFLCKFVEAGFSIYEANDGPKDPPLSKILDKDVSLFQFIPFFDYIQ